MAPIMDAVRAAIGRSRRRYEAPWEFLNVVREAWSDEMAQDLASIPGAARLNILPQSFFLGSQLQDFAAEFRGGVAEVHRHTLYDIRAYSTLGFTQRIYFNENIGSATNGYADTNMQVAGAMAGGESMVGQYLRIAPFPARADYESTVQTVGSNTAFGDWFEILNRNCWLEWKIGDKPYIVGGPLGLFPAGMGPGTVVTAASSLTWRNFGFMNNGDPSNRALYLIDPPLAILPNRSFIITLNWTTALTTPSTAGKLGVFIDGYRVRAVQ